MLKKLKFIVVYVPNKRLHLVGDEIGKIEKK